MKQLHAFESLRGLLALWILINHALVFAGITGEHLGLFQFLYDGGQRANVFFILSGFTIAGLLNHKQETFFPFVTRRFFRIYPVYFLCLLASLPLTQLSLDAMYRLPWQTPGVQANIEVLASTQENLLSHFLAHLTLLHGAIADQLLPHSSHSLLSPAWTLSTEWQFYLLAPAILWVLQKKKPALTGTLIAGTLGIFWIFKGGWYSWGLVFNKIPFLALGLVSHYAWKKQIPMLCVILMTLLIVLLNKWEAIMWLIVFMGAYFNTGLLQHPLLRYFGKISYSVYLIHYPLLLIAMCLLVHFSIFNQTWFSVLLISTALGLSILISHFLFKYVEMPFVDYAKKLTRPKESVIEAASSQRSHHQRSLQPLNQ